MYVKLHQSLLTQSSLATRGPWEALLIWPYILLAADREGHVLYSIERLAQMTSVPRDIWERGIKALMEPDPESLNPAFEGRRLLPLYEHLPERGWRIVNFKAYRDMKDADDKREYMREYMRGRRSAEKRQGSPAEERPEKPEADPVPYAKIVDAYHELLPMCPQVRNLTDKRKAHIRARWKSGRLGSLETWREYFAYCAKSKFLTGQAPSQPGRAPFVADLEWLCNESNFTKVWEQRYHR